jgi:hypothetical protein
MRLVFYSTVSLSGATSHSWRGDTGAVSTRQLSADPWVAAGVIVTGSVPVARVAGVALRELCAKVGDGLTG